MLAIVETREERRPESHGPQSERESCGWDAVTGKEKTVRRSRVWA